MDDRTRRCTNPDCETVYVGDEVEAMFRVRFGPGIHGPNQVLRTTCIGCEQESRDADKLQSRFPQKCRDTITAHSRKYIKYGLVETKREFVERFHWDLPLMERDAERAFAVECPGCERHYGELLGMNDLTLDVYDPKAPPYYPDNCRWICRTCNTGKGDLAPHIWAAKCVGMRKRAANKRAKAEQKERSGGWLENQLFFHVA